MKLLVRALLGLLALGLFAGAAQAACPEAIPPVQGDAQIVKTLNDVCAKLATGGGGAATIADGADVTQGAKADAKSTATDTTPITIMSVLKEISAMVQAPPSQAVTNTGTFATQSAPVTSGGLTMYSGNITTAGSGAGTGGVAVDASAGQLYGWAIYNGNSSACYIQIFDQTQALTNLGTTTPKISFAIPANGAANLTMPIGLPFATAITAGVTTTRAGSTACSTGLDINLWYK